jgi:aminoglycoside phosphotransferase (APT) family kinase protein
MAASPAVTACLQSLAAEDCRCEALVARRDNSRIYRARCTSRVVAIKECFNPGTRTPDPAAAEREFAALTTLSAAMSAIGERPIAPLPLTLCREHAAYTMTWVSGKPMTELLLAHSTDRGKAAALGEAAGGWLKSFHALRPLPAHRNDFVEKIGSIAAILDEGVASDPLLRSAGRALIGCAEGASVQTMPASWIHGDMKSDNLLMDGTAVTGLDVHLIHENTVIHDLVPFLNHLALLHWSPRGLWRGEELKRVASGFLQAYSSETVGWRLPIAWLRAYRLLQVLASARESFSLQALSVAWGARKELSGLLGELSETNSGQAKKPGAA